MAKAMQIPKRIATKIPFIARVYQTKPKTQKIPCLRGEGDFCSKCINEASLREKLEAECSTLNRVAV